MKLKKLLKHFPDIQVRGSKEIEITGLCSHSKLIAPGNLFIAKKGLSHHGSHFIPEAVAAGASAILTDIYDPFLTHVVQLIHPDVANMEAQLAMAYYQFPSNSLFLVGITGTNGKTTCCYLAKHLLDKMGLLSGLIGTVEWVVGKQTYPSLYTTPDVLTLHKLLHEMVLNGCQAAAMEVSSHALSQERVKAIDFDAALFTNLTPEHLDYHHTLEEYAAEKAKLFADLGTLPSQKNYPKIAIVNADSPWVHTITSPCKVETLSYGINEPAALQATEIQLDAKKMQFKVHYQGQSGVMRSSLIGLFNVYNLLAVIALGLSRGLELEAVLEIMHTFKKIPGRLERVVNTRGLDIFVDYAHTEDALKNVLETLHQLKKNRIILVFGCGGNRDRSKRPKMGAVAEALADICIITTDNPRSEDPLEIIQEIVQGFTDPQKALIEIDREKAIYQAISLAQEGDIVLIAGKGHENYQIFSHSTIDFDDHAVALEACKTLG